MHKRKSKLRRKFQRVKAKASDLEGDLKLNPTLSEVQKAVLTRCAGFTKQQLRNFDNSLLIRGQREDDEDDDDEEEEKAVTLYGVISLDEEAPLLEMLDIQHTTPRGFREQLNAFRGEEITLRINSIGGFVTSASQMLTYLLEFRQAGGVVNALVEGTSDSAATLVMVGADTITAAPTASILIHRATASLTGHAERLRQVASSLDSVDEQQVSLYVERTGLEPDEVMAIMVENTPMTAQEAAEIGLVDEILSIRVQRREDDDKDDEDDDDEPRRRRSQEDEDDDDQDDDDGREPEPEPDDDDEDDEDDRPRRRAKKSKEPSASKVEEEEEEDPLTRYINLDLI